MRRIEVNVEEACAALEAVCPQGATFFPLTFVLSRHGAGFHEEGGGADVRKAVQVIDDARAVEVLFQVADAE